MNFDVRRALNDQGNWRLKGLFAAAYHGGDVQQKLAKAWPTGKPSDYRFLSDRQRQNPRTTPDRGYHPQFYMKGDPDVEERNLRGVQREADQTKLENGEPVAMDRYIKRTLLNEDVTELDTLFRETLLDTVVMGAEPYKVARDVATVLNVDTRKGDIPRGSSQIYADSIAQGSEIPTDEENYDTVTFNCQKYGQGFGVTDELIDESGIDVVERQVAFTGAAIENSMNRVFINELVDNAGNEHDTAGSEQDVTMVNRAQEEIEKQNFGSGDALVMHPEFKTSLFEDSNLAYANRSGSDDVLTDRSFNQILGAELFTMSDGAYDAGTQTWGFAADGEIGAVVVNTDFAGLQIYQDLETKEFDDPIRDITGGNVRAHFDANFHQPNAAARVEY